MAPPGQATITKREALLILHRFIMIFMCSALNGIRIQYFISRDGESFESVYRIKINSDSSSKSTYKWLYSDNNIRQYKASVNKNDVRFVKVGAKNINKTPAWHAQPGEVTWLFIDEIEITEKKLKDKL